MKEKLLWSMTYKQAPIREVILLLKMAIKEGATHATVVVSRKVSM